MKKLLFFFLLFSATAQAQDHPLQVKFDTSIVINLTDKAGLQRKATFMGFTYNLENQELALRWRVKYYNDGQQVSIGNVWYEDRMQIASSRAYVNLLGQSVDTVGIQVPFMSEFDFYKLIAQRGTGGNLTINQLIIQAGLRPGRWKD